jgi:hypothetical protein
VTIVSPYLRIRVTAGSLREESSHHNGVKQKTFARWQKHTVKKDSHTANKERQVFIKRKFEDYKSSLNYYPKSAKSPSPGRCSLSSAWRERCMDFVPEKPMLEVDGAPVLHSWAA